MSCPWGPSLRTCDLDVDPGPPGDLGHSLVHVDAEHLDTRRLVLPCADAGSAADIEELHPGARGDDALYEGVGVARPSPVVPFGIHTEGLRYLPESVQLECGDSGFRRHNSSLRTKP